ncbi:MAG: fimbria/pilus outer membrane usher protein [Mariprofundus sp.]|nr:fimbria/pilus outer membrane usher protein [Mariprofundus sp.]
MKNFDFLMPDIRPCLPVLFFCALLLPHQAWAGAKSVMPELAGKAEVSARLDANKEQQAQQEQRWLIHLIEYKERAQADALVTRLGYKNFNASVADLGSGRYQVRILNLSGYDDAVVYRQRLLQKTNIFPAHIQIVAQAIDPTPATSTHLAQSPPESPPTPETAAAAETGAAQLNSAIFHVIVNGEDQGEHFFQLDEQGEIWATVATLKELGVSGIPALAANPTDKPLAFASIKNEMRYQLDTENGELSLTLQPKWLQARQIPLSEEQRHDTEMLNANSVFLNYNVNYAWAQSSASRTVSAPLELGMRIGDLFFSANGDYSSLKVGRKHWTRTQTQLLWDDPEHLLRLTAGDVLSSTGAAGIGAALGGITVAREFGLKPYQVNTPQTSFNLMLPTASDLEVYVNGNLVKQEHVSPGPLTLSNPPFSEGRSDVEIVIRDAFGRETRRSLAYYYSSQLLVPGRSDFSYSLGSPQQRNALGELAYTGSPVALGYHRLGLTRWLTTGAHAAYKGGRLNGGLSADLITGTVGTMNLLVSGSTGGGAHGITGSANYSLTAWDAFSPSLFLRATTPAYRTVFQSKTLTQAARWEAGGSLGFSLFNLGNLSGNYRQRWLQSGVRERDISTFYSAQLFAGIGLTLSGRWRHDSATQHTQESYSLGMNHHFSNGVSLSLSGNRNNGILSASIQIQLSPPLGEGFGYALQASKSEASQQFDSSDRITWRNRYSDLSLSRSGNTQSANYTASGSGALSFIDGSLSPSRPISGGFALVRTDGMANIPVSYNNQLVGTTNSKGELLVPEIIAYNDNALSIDIGSMPMGYQVDATSRNISVPFHSGAVVNFGVHKIQSVEGVLFIHDSKGDKAAVYYGLELIQGEQKRSSIVGDGGEFYIENVRAGEYKARLFNEQRECQFMMLIPESDGAFIKLGKLTCTMKKEKTHD